MTRVNEGHALFHNDDLDDDWNFGCVCGKKWSFGIVRSNIGNEDDSPLWHLAFADFDLRFPIAEVSS